jgi:ATP-dependent DNA ligase
VIPTSKRSSRRRWPLCDSLPLEDVVAGSELVFPVRRLAADVLEAWKQVVERGYEGYVAKDEASVYEGGATRRWLRVKQRDWTLEEDRWRRRIFGEARR